MKKDNVYGSFGILTKDEMLEVKKDFKKLKIGIPKEISFQENRISLTPDAVSLLVHNGHNVLIESNAGKGSNFSDVEYSEAGAEIVYTKEEVYESDVIVKIEPHNIVYTVFLSISNPPFLYNYLYNFFTL